MKWLAACPGDLAEVESIQLGGHTGLNEAPLHLVAIWEEGRKGEDENIFDCIFCGAVSGLIDLLYKVHAMLQAGQVMLERKAFGLIGQRLDGGEDGGTAGRGL